MDVAPSSKSQQVAVVESAAKRGGEEENDEDENPDCMLAFGRGEYRNFLPLLHQQIQEELLG